MSATANSVNVTDYEVIKTKQKTAWSSGDYGRVGVTLQITGEQLAESMDMRSGQSVLDVAAGNGNVTLAAARRFCRVTSTDYVSELLDQSRVRADAEGLCVEYRQADVEQLPFAEQSFDHVVSTFGVMFAPNQSASANELIRVCKPGGHIGMANWTPEGFIGQVFKTIGKYVTPPSGVKSPALWGTDGFLQEHFGHACPCIQATPKTFCFRYNSPAHFMDVFRTYYGPVLKTFEALDNAKRASLQSDMLALIESLNVARDGTMVVPSDYLEIVITRGA